MKNKYNYIDEDKKSDDCSKCYCVCIPIMEQGYIYEREESFEKANEKAKERLMEFIKEMQGIYDEL